MYKRENLPWLPLQKLLYLLSLYGAFAVDLTFLWIWSHFPKALCTIFILHCKFDLRGPRVLQEVWLTNFGLVSLRALVCQHDEVTKPISTVVVSRIKRTRSSSIVLSFHWEHEERRRRSQGCDCVVRELKWKINLCPWILRWICGRGYILAWDFWLRSAGCPDWGVSPCPLRFMKGKPEFKKVA